MGKKKQTNPFIEDTEHCGTMTVRQLVELVETSEFPNGLDTIIRIGDVEGNNGVNGNITVLAHKHGDVVLGIDVNEGDMDYNPVPLSGE